MEDDEDIFDDDESVFELEDDEDNMHDIIIESRASENFWADDLDDEVQEEPAHNRLDRFLLNEERQHNLGIIGQEIDDLHHGNTFTHLNIHNAPH